MRKGLIATAVAGAVLLGSASSWAQAAGDRNAARGRGSTSASASQSREQSGLCPGGGQQVALPDDPSIYFRFAPEHGRHGGIVVCGTQEPQGIVVPIQSTDEALGILAFKPFAPFWPAAERRWGADLSVLRAEMMADDGRETETRYAGMLQRQSQVAVARASQLLATGQTDAAVRQIEAVQTELSRGRNATREKFDFDRVYLALKKASVLVQSDRLRDGADSLAAFLDAASPDQPYRMNGTITLAAYLAELGRHREALALIEPAYATYLAQQPPGEAYRVSGSGREFAWIHACALHGLGRAQEAQQYTAIVTSAPAIPADPYLRNPKTTSQIALRMYRCMNDEAGWFGVFNDNELGTPNSAWLRLQKAYRGYDRMPEGWTVPAEVEARYARRFRQLPSSYDAAIDQWRLSSAAPKATD